MPRIENFKLIKKISSHIDGFGETPLPFAPQISLDGAKGVVPQQYLMVERSVRNLEVILEKIDFADDYLLFAHQENGVLSIQVGIIGCENYPFNAQQKSEAKVVYGRRWLIEPSTPTSEVVQTALLAIKKAREHELRENIQYIVNQQSTTPFNSHMDLPLMKSNPGFFYQGNDNKDSNDQSLHERVALALKPLKIKSHELHLESVLELGHEQCLIELFITQPNDEAQAHFPELVNRRITLFCEAFNESFFAHQLMDELIKTSDRHIEENFTFDGFARFSQKIHPEKIAKFSYQTRNIKHKDGRFHQHFSQMSYDVDASKAPTYASGLLGEKQRTKIAKGGVRAGHFPNEATEELSNRANKI